MTAAALNFRADGIHRPRSVSLSLAASSGKRQTETPGYNDEGINAMSRARYAICRRQVLYPLSYAAGYAGLSNLSWAATLRQSSKRKGGDMKLFKVLIWALWSLAFTLVALPGLAADYPAPK